MADGNAAAANPAGAAELTPAMVVERFAALGNRLDEALQRVDTYRREHKAQHQTIATFERQLKEAEKKLAAAEALAAAHTADLRKVENRLGMLESAELNAGTGGRPAPSRSASKGHDYLCDKAQLPSFAGEGHRRWVEKLRPIVARSVPSLAQYMEQAEGMSVQITMSEAKTWHRGQRDSPARHAQDSRRRC